MNGIYATSSMSMWNCHCTTYNTNQSPIFMNCTTNVTLLHISLNRWQYRDGRDMLMRDGRTLLMRILDIIEISWYRWNFFLKIVQRHGYSFTFSALLTQIRNCPLAGSFHQLSKSFPPTTSVSSLSMFCCEDVSTNVDRLKVVIILLSIGCGEYMTKMILMGL